MVQHSCRRMSTILILQDYVSSIIKFTIDNREIISLVSPLLIYGYTRFGIYRNANNARVLSAVKQAEQGVSSELDNILKTANPNLRDSDGNTLMHYAARAGNRKLVNVLVNYGANLNVINRAKQTPFYEAVFAGQDQIVEDMIRLNRNGGKRFFSQASILNQRTYSGWTPILAAILNRRTAVTSMLIAHGVDLFVKNDKGESTLQLAVQNNDIFLVEFILNNSHLTDEQVMFLINHEDHEHHGTPLYIAAKKGFVEVAELLINRGALNKPTGKRRLTPLHAAILCEHEAVVRLFIQKKIGWKEQDLATRSIVDCVILKGIQRGFLSPIEEKILQDYFADASHRDERYKLSYLPFYKAPFKVERQTITSLHDAVFWDDRDAFQRLLSEGANFDEKNSEGETPLLLAGFYNHSFLAEILIQRGANIHQLNRWGESLLHRAIINNNLKFARILCEKGIDLRYVDSQGYSYMHHVVKYGHTQMASLLLEKGAVRDPKTKNFGNFPLHLAALGGRVDMVALLLFRYRSDPDARNGCDLTPAQLAKDNKAILELLRLAQSIQCEADSYGPKLKQEILKILTTHQEQRREYASRQMNIFDDASLKPLIYH